MAEPLAVTYRVNGFPLHGDGHGLDRVTTLRPGVTRRLVAARRQGQHGVVMGNRNVTLDAPTVRFEHRVTAPDIGNIVAEQALLEDRLDRLYGALAAADPMGVSVLDRYAGGEHRTAQAELANISDPTVFIPGRHVLVTSDFRMSDVSWRSPTWETQQWSFSENLTGVEIEALAGSTAPVSDTVFRVRGPLSSVQIADPVTGRALRWGGNITADQYLYLHPGIPMARITSSASSWASGGSDARSGLDWPPVGLLTLTAQDDGDGVPRIYVNATGGGRTGNTQLTARTRRSYH